MQESELSMKNNEFPLIREMFDHISPKYDFLNRLLSLGKDVYWRRSLVSAMDMPSNGKILDVACGTGDVAIETIGQKGPLASVFGIDFSQRMLLLARDKNKNLINKTDLHLIAGNALNLPFLPETFDAVTIAFGIRNIVDKHAALKAFYKSLKPGGMILILELTMPEKGLLLSCYLLYFNKMLPLIGMLFSKNIKAYKYLPASVIKFPNAEKFAAIMKKAGFDNIRWKKMTLGVVTLFVGYKNKRHSFK